MHGAMGEVRAGLGVAETPVVRVVTAEYRVVTGEQRVVTGAVLSVAALSGPGRSTPRSGRASRSRRCRMR